MRHVVLWFMDLLRLNLLNSFLFLYPCTTIQYFTLYCVFNCSLGQVWKIFIPLQVSRVYDSRKQHNSLHMLEAAGLSKWRIISKSLKKAPKCNTWYKIWAFLIIRGMDKYQIHRKKKKSLVYRKFWYFLH